MNYLKYINRNVNGILLIDKPSGRSSNYILQKIKKIFYAKKAGHAGTLDPIATGMLVICLGKATKFSKYIIDSDKKYEVTAKLGEATDTYDCTGKITKKNTVFIYENQLKYIIKSFIGKIYQIPPMFSAIKYKGIPLYKYAIKGLNILRKPRLINIYNLKLIYFNKNYIKLEIHCSKGTYIRSIVNDLGEKLGCGAHVINLRRLTVSNYSTKDMIKLSKIYNIISNSTEINEIIKNIDLLLLPIDNKFYLYK